MRHSHLVAEVYLCTPGPCAVAPARPGHTRVAMEQKGAAASSLRELQVWRYQWYQTTRRAASSAPADVVPLTEVEWEVALRHAVLHDLDPAATDESLRVPRVQEDHPRHAHARAVDRVAALPASLRKYLLQGDTARRAPALGRWLEAAARGPDHLHLSEVPVCVESPVCPVTHASRREDLSWLRFPRGQSEREVLDRLVALGDVPGLQRFDADHARPQQSDDDLVPTIILHDKVVRLLQDWQLVHGLPHFTRLMCQRWREAFAQQHATRATEETVDEALRRAVCDPKSFPTQHHLDFLQTVNSALCRLLVFGQDRGLRVKFLHRAQEVGPDSLRAATRVHDVEGPTGPSSTQTDQVLHPPPVPTAQTKTKTKKSKKSKSKP